MLGIAGAGAAALVGPEPVLVVIVTAFSVPLIAIDIAEHRIPTRLVWSAGLLCAVVLLAGAIAKGQWSTLALGAIGLAVFGGVHLLAHLVAPASLGFGDVRLAALVGLCAAAVTGTVASLLRLSMVATVVTLVLVARDRGKPAPYAPAVLGSLALTLIVVAAGLGDC